tara:strand:+ start:210 stop:479 length:270 start_codon:yes stop_codon:yes gene_type:complete
MHHLGTDLPNRLFERDGIGDTGQRNDTAAGDLIEREGPAVRKVSEARRTVSGFYNLYFRIVTANTSDKSIECLGLIDAGENDEVGSAQR